MRELGVRHLLAFCHNDEVPGDQMPVESNTLWAEWNAAFEALKLAHEKLRGLAHSPPDNTERRDATREWLDARAAYNRACAQIPI
jgi:hypothetical protein